MKRSVDYAKFTAVLVEAVKELHQQLKEKNQDISMLRTELEMLKQKIQETRAN